MNVDRDPSCPCEALADPDLPDRLRAGLRELAERIAKDERRTRRAGVWPSQGTGQQQEKAS